MVHVGEHMLAPQVVVISTALEPFATPPDTSPKLTEDGLAETVRELTAVSGDTDNCRLTTRIACAPAAIGIKPVSPQNNNPYLSALRIPTSNEPLKKPAPRRVRL